MGRFPELTPVRSQAIEPWLSTLEAGDTGSRKTDPTGISAARADCRYRPAGRGRRTNHVSGGSRTRTYAYPENNLGPTDGRKSLRRHQSKHGRNSPCGLQATLENLFGTGSTSTATPLRIRSPD